MSFENNIRKWVYIDNQIKGVNAKMKLLREERDTINNSIFEHVQQHNLNKSVIKISDGTLKFDNIKTIKPLSIKFLESCLDNVIPDPLFVKKIMEHIKSKREYQVNTNIKRNYK